jgi:hypothetical protein
LGRSTTRQPPRNCSSTLKHAGPSSGLRSFGASYRECVVDRRWQRSERIDDRSRVHTRSICLLTGAWRSLLGLSSVFFVRRSCFLIAFRVDYATISSDKYTGQPKGNVLLLQAPHMLSFELASLPSFLNLLDQALLIWSLMYVTEHPRWAEKGALLRHLTRLLSCRLFLLLPFCPCFLIWCSLCGSPTKPWRTL